MTDQLATNAEQNAAAAEKLVAFSGLNLLHIRRGVSDLLDLIGRSNIFEEYTLHNITHIDAMLRSLEWIIPPETQRVMSPADWLLLVMATYFHDLGMLVTKEEYGARRSSGFQTFCDTHLFSGEDGHNYRDRLEKTLTDPDDRDRFLYQEFVRYNHGTRIREWLTGSVPHQLGNASDAFSAVHDLVSRLDATFVRDLALICESHHLDDIGNTTKYQVSQPYGNSDAETANVQYAAIILRTADLLHITRDRTPPILFKAINPTDPISQREWAKQMAVRNVRPQRQKRNLDGDVVSQADTIEVHARFTDADGFFGLTAYLIYASSQLKQSQQWAEQANRAEGVAHEFHWRRIDDSGVEAAGFIPTSFAFEVDKKRILDLLTGHTLYNDGTVVLRELIQNALDAVRLQRYIDSRSFRTPVESRVSVYWNPKERLLRVSDNGTGMTQAMIEQHFLRVGSSRYQEVEFRKEYPDFSAISRFGIGVLSCFMVADDVDVFTVHPQEPDARHISLRSLHGKYLIRLLNKATDPAATSIGLHGTEVRLKIRSTAKLGDVMEAVSHWVVRPECRVEVVIDNAAPVSIGFATMADALKDALVQLGYYVSESPIKLDESDFRKEYPISIRQHTKDGVELAYAVEWSKFFRQWTFLDLSLRHRAAVREGAGTFPQLGVSIQGIRVEDGSPGYRNVSVAAMANATGKASPKTNVARSRLEATSEYSDMLDAIYAMLADHVKREVTLLHSRRGFSLTRATQEASYIGAPLIRDAISRSALKRQIDDVPMFIVESEDEGRRAVSANYIASFDEVWTADCALYRSAEYLLQEVDTSASLGAIVKAVGRQEHLPPAGVLVSTVSLAGGLTNSFTEKRDVGRIVIRREQRRVDLMWVPASAPRLWEQVDEQVVEKLDRRDLRIKDFSNIRVGSAPISIDGADGETAVRASGMLYILFGSDLTDLLLGLVRRANRSSEWRETYACVSILSMAVDFYFRRYSGLREAERKELVEERIRHLPSLGIDVASVFAKASWDMFDPSAWQRKDES